MKEKRKNEVRRRFPWWGLLVAGFALGIVVTLLLVRLPQQPIQNQNQVVLPTLASDDPLLLTATAIVESATGTARALNTGNGPAVMTPQAANQGAVDPIALTATRVVEQATLQAADS